MGDPRVRKKAKKWPFLDPCGAKSRGSGGAPPTHLILLRNQRERVPPPPPRTPPLGGAGGGGGARRWEGGARSVARVDGRVCVPCGGFDRVLAGRARKGMSRRGLRLTSGPGEPDPAASATRPAVAPPGRPPSPGKTRQARVASVGAPPVGVRVSLSRAWLAMPAETGVLGGSRPLRDLPFRSATSSQAPMGPRSPHTIVGSEPSPPRGIINSQSGT